MIVPKKGFGFSKPKLKKAKFHSFILSLFRYAFLIFAGYIIIYPVIYMICTSIKSASDFNDVSYVWIAHNPTFDNFKLALKAMNFKKSLFATLLYEVISSLIQVVSCAFPAYSLARYKMRESPIYIFLLLLMICVPTQMVIIPLVINFSHLDFLGILGLVNKTTGVDLRLNILDSVGAFWLPSLFGVGLRSGVLIYIYMQFFKGLPKELEEAAWVDGSNPLQTFFRIIVPSSTVVIFTVTIFSVIWHWNDYYVALMYTNSKYTLAIALSQIRQYLTTLGMWGTNGLVIGTTMAGCVVFIAPMLVMYIILQRKFVKSIDSVGITG